MNRPQSPGPTFTPGARLSRLPLRSAPESLEDFYRDLFANTGPEHDRQRLLRLLDEDVADGAAAHGRKEAMDHLDQAFCRIDAWTFQGDYLPEADRAELKRRAAHNLLAVRPGLDLATEGDGHTGPDRALLREVQTEHAAWRRGWAAESPAGPRSRQPWDEQPGPRQPRQPWDEQPGPRPGPEEAWDQQEGKPIEKARKTYWVVIPEPTACDKCLALAAQVHAAKPERPHPNCKCEIIARTLTAGERETLRQDLARRAEAARAERDRREREKQAARNYVDGRQWRQDGDRVRIGGQDAKGNAVKTEFPGCKLPGKTPGGVAITYGKATADGPTADRRVTREMRDTVQEVLDDPRVKAAGVTSVNISCTTNGAHAEGSSHYHGRAVDISRINGKPLSDPAAREQAKVIQEVVREKQEQGKVEENFGPQAQLILYKGQPKDVPGQASGHQNHIHISVP